MPVISAVKPQKNNKRLNIYIDGKFALGLDLENYVKMGLKVGNEIPQDILIEITKKAEFQKIFDRLLVFASMRPRSGKEINDWMFKKKVSENIKARLIDKINKLNLLNDVQFARWWVDQRIAFKNKSVKDLKYELRRKGIGKEMIAKALADTEFDELGSAKVLIKKYNYKWTRFPVNIGRQKKRIFLSRKGFSWDTIKKAVE